MGKQNINRGEGSDNFIQIRRLWNFLSGSDYPAKRTAFVVNYLEGRGLNEEAEIALAAFLAEVDDLPGTEESVEDQYHTITQMIEDLVQEGYDRKLVEGLYEKYTNAKAGGEI